MASQERPKRTLTSRFVPSISGRSGQKPKNIIYGEPSSDEDNPGFFACPPKWSFGVLNDKTVIDVPGSVLLFSNNENEPLGQQKTPARSSHSSGPAKAQIEKLEPRAPVVDYKKKSPNGKIILEPQPEDSANDPLNWPTWRRNAALLSLGLYSMVGGGMTPVLAAGFSNVADDYHVSVARVPLTTGLFMMGMGIGSVFFSPSAILWGKRPVYLSSVILFASTSVWCASSPSFSSLLAARTLQGVAVSPVECLPSATIAEIFFLHERAFRIGIYTLLLLAGKNLAPLVSAATIQSLNWHWIFRIIAVIVAFCGVLLLLFLPETFWERAPVPRERASSRRPSTSRRESVKVGAHGAAIPVELEPEKAVLTPGVEKRERPHKDVHFAVANDNVSTRQCHISLGHSSGPPEPSSIPPLPAEIHLVDPKNSVSPLTALAQPVSTPASPVLRGCGLVSRFRRTTDTENQTAATTYSEHWRTREAKSFAQQLRPWHGRLKTDSWLKIAFRPFVLFSYPAVLWSAAVYSCSVGWLIVISESVTVIYRQKYYHFNALSTGLMYISLFIGGVLGTAVAGKVSDIIVKAMACRNGGLYEPEFRLVMTIPVAGTTALGLMGYGWAAEAGDAWIVPTVFLGMVSFGCSLGSTTSICFCLDSYRQYAGEALVTLNFSKNVLHGLIFSFFIAGWIEADGAKIVFISIGIIQLVLLAFTVPMFLYGKRARMWTVRQNLMEKF